MSPPRRRVLRLADYACTPDVDLSDLAQSDTCRRMTLRRADRGGLTEHGELIVDGGRRLPRQLELATRDLIRDGLLAVAPRPGGTLPRVELTEHGRAELARLDAEHERHLTARRAVPSTSTRPRAPKEDLMTPMTLVFVVICALVFVALLIRNLLDRPSPLGTDAEQRERARP